MRLTMVCTAALCVCLIGSDRPPAPPAAPPPAPAPAPRSPAAVSAIKRYEAACKAADDEARQAKAAAGKKLAKDLEKPMKDAMASRNLDEANAIKAALDRAQSDGGASAGDIVARVGGSTWKYGGDRDIVKYSARGEVIASTWKSPLRWVPVNARTIKQEDPGPAASVTVTFTDDFKHALWVYENGKAIHATRAP